MNLLNNVAKRIIGVSKVAVVVVMLACRVYFTEQFHRVVVALRSHGCCNGDTLCPMYRDEIALLVGCVSFTVLRLLC